MSNSSEREQYKTPLQQVNSFTAYQWVVWMDARIHVMNNKSNDYNEYAFAFPDLGIIDIISPIEGLLTLFNLLNKKAKEQFRQGLELFSMRDEFKNLQIDSQSSFLIAIMAGTQSYGLMEKVVVSFEKIFEHSNEKTARLYDIIGSIKGCTNTVITMDCTKVMQQYGELPISWHIDLLEILIDKNIGNWQAIILENLEIIEKVIMGQINQIDSIDEIATRLVYHIVYNSDIPDPKNSIENIRNGKIILAQYSGDGVGKTFLNSFLKKIP